MPDPLVAATATLGIWAWESIAKPLFEGATESAIKGATDGAKEASGKAVSRLWKNVSWATAETQYRARLLESVERTHVLGHPRPLDLGNLYTDVRVFDAKSAFWLAQLEDNAPRTVQEHEDRFPRKQGLEVLASGKNLYILGRPGAGKTTFLKYITRLCCNSSIDRVPILVELRESGLSTKVSGIDILAGEFDVCHFPDPKGFVQRLLNSGRALVLIDGLDEVSDEDRLRTHVVRELVKLARFFPKTQFCVACRIAATEYTFERFEYVAIADFSDEQKLHFIAKWFEYDSLRHSKFLDYWSRPECAGLREIARTPLLLVLTCLSFESNLDLPSNRVYLFRDAVDALLRKWDVTRNVIRDKPAHSLKLHRFEHLLSHLAAHNFMHDRIIFGRDYLTRVMRDWIASLPPPEGQHLSDGQIIEIVHGIESGTGLLVSRARDKFSFSHLVLQEYFIASSLIRGNSISNTVALVRPYFTSRKWREVFLFACELSPDATDFIRGMATECSVLMHRRPGCHAFQHAIVQLLEQIEDSEKFEAERAIEFTSNFCQRNTPEPDSVALTKTDREKLAAILRRTFELLAGADYARHRRLVRTIHTLVAQHWSSIKPYLGYPPRARRQGIESTLSYLEYLEAVQLTVECALRAVCRDRSELLWRCLRGIDVSRWDSLALEERDRRV